jgi:hypothetical protein
MFVSEIGLDARYSPGRIPAPQTRPPTAYVSEILFVFTSELLTQCRFFIKHDEQMHATATAATAEITLGLG